MKKITLLFAIVFSLAFANSLMKVSSVIAFSYAFSTSEMSFSECTIFNSLAVAERPDCSLSFSRNPSDSSLSVMARSRLAFSGCDPVSCSKKIGLVINTGGGNSEHRLDDAIALRRGTLKNKIPYCTNMSTALACLEAIRSLKTKRLEVISLQDI